MSENFNNELRIIVYRLLLSAKHKGKGMTLDEIKSKLHIEGWDDITKENVKIIINNLIKESKAYFYEKEIYIATRPVIKIKGRSFKINEYITLKLEDNKTNVYILGELFKQCMGLMLNIPTDVLKKIDMIHSIDEIDDFINPGDLMYYNDSCDITPEEEFQAHCSNMTVWAENEYNTEILHRTIAFPLLKQLTKIGDEKAKKVFKEEIAYRFTSGNLKVRIYLIEEGYINYLTKEEFWNMFPFGSQLAEIEKELNTEFVYRKRSNTEKEYLYFLRSDVKEFVTQKDSLLIGMSNFHLSTSKWQHILKILSSIKTFEIIINLRYTNFEITPDVSDLKSLKYLNISSSKETKLPKPITNLQTQITRCEIIHQFLYRHIHVLVRIRKK